MLYIRFNLNKYTQYLDRQSNKHKYMCPQNVIIGYTYKFAIIFNNIC